MRRRHRPLKTLAAILALTVLAVGCGAEAGGGDTDSSGESTPAESAADRIEPLPGPAPEPLMPVTVDSADGREVTITSVDRVLPLSGSLSEIVFSLGLGDQVVGRDVTATFEQAADLPVVTRGHDISAEGVLSLHPDVVLIDSTTGPAEAVDQIRSAGIPLVVFDPPQELSDVGPRIEAVAGALGTPDAGQALTERTGERLTAAQENIPSDGDKPTVAFLYLRGSASVYLLGGAESGASSLIEAAGGIDAGKESGLDKDFTPITSEALAAAAPEVILVMSKGLESVGGIDGMLEIPGIAETPAGMNGRVASVDDGVLLNYGPRTNEVLADLAEQIHAGGEGS